MTKTTAYKFLPSSLADRLKEMSIEVRRPLEGNRQGLHKSPHYGSSVEFAEYRDYMPGDPPNLLDWSVLARSDRYVVRKFQEETNLSAHVLLDTSASLGFKGEGNCSKIEFSSFLAAGLGYILVRQGDSVGLLTFDDAIRVQFAPVASFEGLRPILLKLEEIIPQNRGNIEKTLHEAAEKIKRRSLFFVISDFLQPPEQIIRGVYHLRHNGHEATLLHVIDRAEICLPYGGVAEVTDLETHEKMTVEMDEIRNAYTLQVEEHIRRLRKGCMDCSATYCVVETTMTVEDALGSRTRHA